jgi:hypothetical protein
MRAVVGLAGPRLRLIASLVLAVASSPQPWQQWPLPRPRDLGVFLVLPVSSTCSMIASLWALVQDIVVWFYDNVLAMALICWLLGSIFVVITSVIVISNTWCMARDIIWLIFQALGFLVNYFGQREIWECSWYYLCLQTHNPFCIIVLVTCSSTHYKIC